MSTDQPDKRLSFDEVPETHGRTLRISGASVLQLPALGVAFQDTGCRGDWSGYRAGDKSPARPRRALVHAITVESYPATFMACWMASASTTDGSYSNVTVRALISASTLPIPCTRRTAVRMVMTQPSQVMSGTFSCSVFIVLPFLPCEIMIEGGDRKHQG